VAGNIQLENIFRRQGSAAKVECYCCVIIASVMVGFFSAPLGAEWFLTLAKYSLKSGQKSYIRHQKSCIQKYFSVLRWCNFLYVFELFAEVRPAIVTAFVADLQNRFVCIGEKLTCMANA
jgi:hypothetical protein